MGGGGRQSVAERQKDPEIAQLAVFRVEAAVAAFRECKEPGPAAVHEAWLAKARALAAAPAKDPDSLTLRPASA